MPKGKRKCKICGKEYDYCKTELPANIFRWQDVACSHECGVKYFALVEAARSGNDEAKDKAPVVTKAAGPKGPNEEIPSSVDETAPEKDSAKSTKKIRHK